MPKNRLKTFNERPKKDGKSVIFWDWEGKKHKGWFFKEHNRELDFFCDKKTLHIFLISDISYWKNDRGF